MIFADTDNDTRQTRMVPNPESTTVPYCRLKLRKCGSYAGKHYDDFNSTILYPVESILPAHESLLHVDTHYTDRHSHHSRPDTRSAKRSNRSLSDVDCVSSIQHASRLDSYMRRDENRTSYELSKQAAVVHERLLHTIDDLGIDCDEDYDADYDNDCEAEMETERASCLRGKHGRNGGASGGTACRGNTCTAIDELEERRLQLELEELERMEELEELETLELSEKLEAMDIYI